MYFDTHIHNSRLCLKSIDSRDRIRRVIKGKQIEQKGEVHGEVREKRKRKEGKAGPERSEPTSEA